MLYTIHHTSYTIHYRFLTAQCKDWIKNVVNFVVYRSKSPIWGMRRGLMQAITQVMCVVYVLV
ncbi:hypothetical protein EON63_22485 [archaeon]|nr:MAG: hypothetical protein EON63_22485 [archaeon]